MKIAAVVAFTAFGFVGLAWGQQYVNQGGPGNQGSWVVATPCVTVVETVTTLPGLDAGNVPATAQTNRKVILVCNSPENTGTPIVKCRADGTVPVIGVAAAGQALSKGDCVTYSTTAVVKCISDTVSTIASASECK